ncbi:hypothetical protein GGI35DRAFT_362898 [Trichoderma velutinum]
MCGRVSFVMDLSPSTSVVTYTKLNCLTHVAPASSTKTAHLPRLIDTFRYQASNWHYQVQQPLYYLPRLSKTEPRYGTMVDGAQLSVRTVSSAVSVPSFTLYSYKYQLKLTSTRWRGRSGRCH